MNRISQLQEWLPTDISAALITSDINRRYFTGFKSSAGTLLVTRKRACFIVDFRYFEAAKAGIRGCEILLQNDLFGQIAGILAEEKAKSVAVESGTVTLDELARVRSKLPKTEILADSRLQEQITAQRRIKSREELALMRQAQDLTDETFRYIAERISPGRTELEIALEMEFFIRKAGAVASFDFIVVSGANSSRPHGVPTEKKLEHGDFLTMDFGAAVDGYCADMTRTVAIGAADEQQREVYATVLEAQTQALAAIRAGVVCMEIDKIARDIIHQAGYAGCFGHGLGHALGMEVHEMPAFNSVCMEKTVPGLVMSVEPGIYLEGKFGCRIEDVVYITADGCVNLTASEKKLMIL